VFHALELGVEHGSGYTVPNEWCIDLRTARIEGHPKSNNRIQPIQSMTRRGIADFALDGYVHAPARYRIGQRRIVVIVVELIAVENPGAAEVEGSRVVEEGKVRRSERIGICTAAASADAQVYV